MKKQRVYDSVLLAMLILDHGRQKGVDGSLRIPNP
jgi:hypothetical protein